MTLAHEVAAIRTAVAVTRLDHVTVFRVGGPGAFAMLDALCPGALFLRENQMRHTLLLSPDGRPLADIYVCSDDQEFILLAQGLSSAGLRAYLEEHRVTRAGDASVTLEDVGATHVMFGIDGPYAWELAAALLGPEVNGTPYLSFLRFDNLICFRAGTTGEYGFDLLVPKAEAGAVWERLFALGEPLGVQEAHVEALDQCALENWHFYMRMLDGAPQGAVLTPIELQLQWRVSYEKDFVGSDALRVRRESGVFARATCFTTETPVTPGRRVFYDGREIGVVLASTASCTRGEGVGVALLEPAFAHPGIDRFVVESVDGPIPMLTRTPPIINNRSLHVDPNRHSARTRHEDVFPPLVAS